MTRADELFAQMGYDPAVAAEMGVPQFARLPEQGPIVEPRWPEWLPWGSDILAEQAMRFMSPGDVPSWQMPYPMPATQGERDVLGMLPVAGDVEDVRYLMEGIQQGDPAMAAMGGAAAMMPFVPASLLHTVYHGSPHIFDAFKMERIGTGEGAQAFGHGLYFAEAPGTAKAYQSALSGGQLWRDAEGAVVDPYFLRASGDQDLANAADAVMQRQSVQEALDDIGGADAAAFVGGAAEKESTLRGLQELELMGVVKEANQGALYKVEIPDEAVGRMLDWDKPLSEQSEGVRAALQNARWGRLLDESMTGEQALRRLEELGNVGFLKRGTPQPKTVNELASEMLRQAGIPGIRYLDQGSRTTGEGTRNIVLFDESLAKIMERK